MKKNEEFHIRIGDMTFKVTSDLPYSAITQNIESFLIDRAPHDFEFVFHRIGDIPEYTGRLKCVEVSQISREMINEHGEFYRGFVFQGDFFDAVLKLDEKSGDIAYVSEELIAQRIMNGLDISSFFGLEHVFMRRGGFFLHSSHVNVDGRALVFSAPSGTGKSTQAELWRAHTGAQVINGDRSLLRKRDGVWHAHGCPMCGTSGIHLQGAEPIHAIVMLEQGKDNSLERLGAKEAFSLLYPQVTVPRWNRELVLTAMELLDSVIAEIPVYRYSCTKTEDAVFVLKDALGL